MEHTVEQTEAAETTSAPEAAETVETVEATDAEPAAEASSGKTWRERIDEVLARNTPDKPAEPEPTPEPAPSADGKKLSWDEAYSRAEPEAQQLMKQLRAEATRRFQEAAAMKREAEADKAAIFDSPFYKGLQEVASSNPDVDLLDPNSVRTYINTLVQQGLHQALEPARQAHQSSIAQSRYNEFLEANPELKTNETVRGEVADLLRSNKAMKLEDAYFIVKGRQARRSELSSDARRAAERRAARAAAVKVSTPPSRAQARRQPVIKKGARSFDIYETLKRARDEG